ncbi:MAG: hypothetical protein GF311_28215 [Candidatus Lokiarchaeota archaeon]|nr:hypothetical protein [Candidatus Lokiarchaeota archaeon]
MGLIDTRITVNLEDRSQTILEDLSYVGGTNIRALKGPDEPVLIFPKQEKLITQMFGTPTSTYTDVWNLIEYNKNYPVYACSATVGGRYGGVLVTKTGTEAFTGGFTTIDSISFSALQNIEILGTGDASTTTFTASLSNYLDYNAETVDLIVNGTAVSLTVSTLGVTETLTATGIYAGSGTLNTSTGDLSFTFDTAPANNVTIEVTYTIDRSDDVYFLLYNPYREADDTAVLITYASNLFTIKLYDVNSDGTYTEIQASPFPVSLTEGSKDGFGINNYIGDVFQDSHYIRPIINTALAVTTFVDDTVQIELDGGTRGTHSITTGYNYFQQAEKYPVDLFFDGSGEADVITVFDSLSKNYQKYATYIFGLPLESVSNALTTVSGYSLNNNNIKVYWNYMQIKNTYTDGTFYACPIGRIAYNHGKNRENFYSGRQVSWINENEVGGQLGTGFIRAYYSPLPSEVTQLENANINPIVFHPVYGVMVTNDATQQTITSDYSDGGHVGLRNYLVNTILQDVLPFQIDKPNDTEHRNNVRSQVELIMSGPSATPGLLNWYVVKCDEENNNATVRAKKQFIIEVAVQFTPFSKTIVFNFINYGQTVEVNEAFV